MKINAEAIIEQMKIEILSDIDEGVIPMNVHNFSELHDYVDANCYGGFCDDTFADQLIEHFGGRDKDEGMPQRMLDLINRCQVAIDLWLRNGRLFVMGSGDINNLAQCALNAACKLIQDELGVTDGGLAGIMFSDDHVLSLFEDYIKAEIEKGTSE